MATFGRIDPFDEKLESWPHYSERLIQYFMANDVQAEEKKRAVFLTVLGPTAYGLLRSLVSPAKPTDKSFDELLQILNNHYSPAPSEIVERFRFNSRLRKANESVATFVSELRKLAEHCHFGDTLEQMLRDRMVCGIQDDQTQRRLLAEPALTFDKALKLALAIERATRDARDLNATQQPQSHSDCIYKINKLPVNNNNRSKPKFGGQQGRTSIGQNYSSGPSKFKRLRCIRCGREDHSPTSCPFSSATCHSCGKVGHLSKVCLSTKNKTSSATQDRFKHFSPKVHSIRQLPENTDEYNLFHVPQFPSRAPEPMYIQLEVNDQLFSMELDTGAALTMMSLETFNRTLGRTLTLADCNTTLKSFSGHHVDVLGTSDVCVRHLEQEVSLPLLVYRGSSPTLCGRNWIFPLNLLDKQVVIHHVGNSTVTLNEILERHREVFKPDLGLLKGVEVHLDLKENALPKFCKARSVPYAYRDLVDKELNRLQEAGIITPVAFSAFASPIVPVLKRDKQTVRICGDFKIAVNPALNTEQYPLPKIEDIFANLSGGVKFSKLDLKDAFFQLALDEESRKIVVINTQKGLFEYNRLPFGVSSAPAIFQRVMDTLMQGTSGTAVFQDDLVVTGTDDEDHLRNLNEALTRIENAGLRLKEDKCEFFQESIEYLGHVLDSTGLHPTEAKMKAIEQAPTPTSADQLRSFLGLLQYYHKFLPNLSTELAPLHILLNKNQPWFWNQEQEIAFVKAKDALRHSNVLAHFDPSKEILLACDASPFGLGAVLSIINDQGDEQPVSFASRSLSQAEKNYSQLEREALALVFGVTKFRDYLLGRRFGLITDHRPLVSLLSETKGVTTMAASRIQRWALTLGAYNYKLVFKEGRKNTNADAFSRLPLPLDPSQQAVPQPAELVLLVDQLTGAPITLTQIESAVQLDPVLHKIMNYVTNGWPLVKSTDVTPFWNRQSELSCYKGVLLWGNRVVVPDSLHNFVLEELHAGHQGMTKMKSLARSLFWWPNMDLMIESLVRNCNDCQQAAHLPPAKYTSWPDCNIPWQRIHIDHAGPLDGKWILVVVDSCSKWIEAIPVSTPSALTTVEVLRSLFARFGLPSTIVSDNGTAFTAREFQEFVQQNGIRHIRTAPYHPASNGLAERAVQTIKRSLQKSVTGSLNTRLSRFLIMYRRTPTSSGRSPAELLLGRTIRTRLDLLHPNNKNCDTFLPGEHVPSPLFDRNTEVFARNFGKGPNWTTGTIKDTLGSQMFLVSTALGDIRRHRNQLRRRFHSVDDTTGSNTAATDNSIGTSSSSTGNVMPYMDLFTSLQPPLSSATTTSVSAGTLPTTSSTRASTRVRKAPDRLGL